MMQSTRRVAAATVGVAVFLIVVWYLALFSPQSSSLKKANAAYSAAQKQDVQLQSQIAQLQALERQVPQDKARLDQLDKAVPKTPDLQDMLDQLHALAVSTGVQLTTVTPTIASTSGGAASAAGGQADNQIQLSMSTTGTYDQLRAFLTGLNAMQRVIVVNQLSVGGNASGLAATITAHMFYAP